MQNFAAGCLDTHLETQPCFIALSKENKSSAVQDFVKDILFELLLGYLLNIWYRDIL